MDSTLDRPLADMRMLGADMRMGLSRVTSIRRCRLEADWPAWPLRCVGVMSAALVMFGCAARNAGGEGAPCPVTRADESKGAAGPHGVASERAAEGVPHAIVRRENHRIEFGELALEVDAVDGGRIVEFSLGGRSVVIPKGESAQAYGSSFWPSPQKAWDWPPPAELDALPWSVSIDGRVLVLESRTNEKLGLSATQRIEALPEKGAVRIELALHNRGSAPLSVAAWQNTRTRPGGLTFYPSTAPALPPSAFPLDPQGGVAWFDHDPRTNERKGKLFADGEEGWIAHVDGDLLFVKVFPPVAREKQAPGEAEVEIYVDPAGGFVEVEQQGPYGAIEPGHTARWQCHWLLAKLEPDARRVVGDGRLLAQARALARRVD